MPRARDPRPQINIPQTFGPGGKSSPVAALVAAQQQQQEQFSKLIDTMRKAEEDNARAVQEAAQAGGSAATRVANLVARGVEKQEQQTRRTQERAEDKEFAVQQQELNAELQAQAAKEAAAMGAAIQGQRDNIMNFRDSFLAKRASFEEATAAFATRTDRMLTAGHFSSPEGRKKLRERAHHLSMMKTFRDDHFDDRHLAAAFRSHNKSVQSLIQGDPMDLSSLIVEPEMMPMVDLPHDGGKRIAGPGEISPDKMFELKILQGYPERGVVFNDEENYGLPEGYTPKLNTANLLINARAKDDFLTMATDTALRQELTRKTTDIVVEGMDKLRPLYETYKGFNKMFNPMAGAAIERSLETFLADPNPNKFNDMGRQLVFGAVVEMFNGSKEGEKIAGFASEIFDGKREPKSDKELLLAMALESALFNIKEQMMTEFQSVGEGGASLATTLVQQMEAEIGPEQTALALGVPSNAVGLVKGLDVMQSRLAEASAFANRTWMGFEKNSLLEQFSDDMSQFARDADIFAYRVLNEGEDNERRVRELLGTEEVLEGAAERVAATPLGEVSGSLTRINAADLQTSMSNIDAILGIAGELGPDTINAIATGLTNEITPLTTPNLQPYINQTRVEGEASGYSKNAIEGASFNYRRNQRAKKAREAASPQQGPGSIGESFEKGGAIGTLAEQVPAMLSLGFAGAHRGIERAAIHAVAGIAGRGTAESTLRGLRKVEGGIARGVASGLAPREESNLTQREREQILRSGQ